MVAILGRGMVVLLVATACLAAEPMIPPSARHCELAAPPADSGAYVTPGGFLLVYPRNSAVPDNYTGCRTIWVVRTPSDVPLLMRNYFQAGRLVLVQAYDGRGGAQVRASCELPNTRRECQGLDANPLVALKVPTWPRACMDTPDLPVCAGDPE